MTVTQCGFSVSPSAFMACVGCVQSTVDKLLKKTNLSLVLGTSSWKEQFIDAVSISAGETATHNPRSDHLQIRRGRTQHVTRPPDIINKFDRAVCFFRWQVCVLENGTACCIVLVMVYDTQWLDNA